MDAQGINQYFKAGYPIVWIDTHEEARAIEMLCQEGKRIYEDRIYAWDVVQTMHSPLSDWKSQEKVSTSVAFLKFIETWSQLSCLWIGKDFAQYLQGLDVARALKNLIPYLKANDNHLVIISSQVKLPPVLEKDIVVVPLDLPSKQELESMVSAMAQGYSIPLGDDDHVRKVVEAAMGLTKAEAENAMARSLVATKAFTPDIIETEKLQAIRASGLMEVYEAVPMDHLRGLEPLKRYLMSRHQGFVNPKLPTPRGIILVGLPGAGKTLTAKVTASIFGMRLIRLDIASLKGSLVGESERQMKAALKLIDAIAPCVVWMDELEKAIGGVQSSNKTDGGTTSAMFGFLLTWMSEHTTPVYPIATCNDIGVLLSISQGALLRRFDDIFFLDVPSASEREEILDFHAHKYGTTITTPASVMQNWTGAEIEKFVMASLYDGEIEARRNVKPIYYQNRTIIEQAREWARDNARFANTPAPIATPKEAERTLQL